MVTIRDVARVAGVSTATVSYVINNKPGVNEVNRSKIRRVIEELGYTPSQEARNLSSKKSNLIGLLVSDVLNVYNVEFLKHIERFVREQGMQLMLSCFSDSRADEIGLIDNFIAQNVSGLILCPGGDSRGKSFASALGKLRKNHIPTVFFYYPCEEEGCSCILPDLEAGEYELTRYLIGRGIRNAVFFGSVRGDFYSEVRFEGFSRALEEIGVSPEGRFVSCGTEIDFDAGAAAIGEFLNHAELPEAIVCINDMVAYGVIKGLKDRGIRVPEDVSVTGFDGVKVPTMEDLALTTVAIPLEQMSRRGVELLMSGKTNKEIIKTELVIGNTVGRRL